MSAAHQVMSQRVSSRGILRRFGRPRSWQLFALPSPVVGYVFVIIAADLGLTVRGILHTPVRAVDVALFAALLACGAICIEATRRLGQPTGVSRDLLSAWWLPIALLLPPVYALLAPVVLGGLLYLRVRRTPAYRRLFSSAALGLAGGSASTVFRHVGPTAMVARSVPWVAHPASDAWFTRPAAVLIAIGCAVLFNVLNTGMVAVAAHAAQPQARWAEVLWDRESLLLDLTEICVGVLVVIGCALSPVLLFVALPPVIVLQRSLMHQQLQAAARTDAKTGLLNATAWQREADTEIARARRAGETLALLLCDVDHFKRINDTYGHLTGDDVLRGLATELRQQVRGSDVVGRFGGEEFVVLLPHADADEACKIAERLRHRASVMGVYADSDAVTVTISIGVAVLGAHGHDLFELLAAADLALYRAKDAGRDQICVYSPDGQPCTDSHEVKAPDPAALRPEAAGAGAAAGRDGRRQRGSRGVGGRPNGPEDPAGPNTLGAMPEFIYQMRAVRKAYGDKVILDDVTLSFLPGAKIGVVGPNGTGKSTLLKLMAGIDQPSNGEARLMPGFTVGLLSQEPQLNEDKTVLGNVEEGVAETKAMLDKYNEIAEKMATEYSDELLEEMGQLQEQLDHRDAWDLDSQLEQAMDALRCPPPDASVKPLSGGERRRVALCRLLLSQPDLLLLDEPTNHLDAESVQWLEQHLESYAGTVVAVTHDRYFLENAAQWILELDRGHAYPYQGNYSTYLDTKASRIKVEGAKDVKRRKRLEDELEWVRSNPRARQAKSRARLQRYEEMAAEADARRKLDFEEIQIPPGPRLGGVVVETEGLVKGFGDRVLFDGLSFSLPRNGIVGVIGPNGVGKTTLFKMIVGEEKPDAGSLRIGETVEISYVDQSRERIAPEKNVWEAISDGETHINVGHTEIPSRAYVAAFGFKGPDQQKPAGVLSGGERNRVNLALTLKKGGNLLLLDEPTNDLDVETLSSLENALLDFPGCAVITSHDRWFLDRIATHILAWEGGANWFWFEGNFDAYEKNKIERLGAEAARPHRVTYRRLTRT
jgi:ATP-binding cassette ChvD family protein